MAHFEKVYIALIEMVYAGALSESLRLAHFERVYGDAICDL